MTAGSETREDSSAIHQPDPRPAGQPPAWVAVFSACAATRLLSEGAEPTGSSDHARGIREVGIGGTVDFDVMPKEG